MAGQTVSDVMTKDPKTVPGSTPLIEAARMMRDEDIGPILVLDNGQVEGIVTDRDIVVRGIAEGADPARTSVRDACSTDLETLSPSDSVDRAVALMRDKAIRRLPVVDEAGKPVGIVSLGDLAIERDPDSALAEISEAPASG
jgi:CBS domain-containing protein